MSKFDLPISPRVQALRDKRARINKDLHLNIERNRILTEYYMAHESEYPVLKRAGFLYQWCATREINIDDDDIFLGDTGPHTRTVGFDIEGTSQVWIRDCFGDTDERFRAAWQVPGSVWVSDEERAFLVEASKFWDTHDIGATAKGLMPPEVLDSIPPFAEKLGMSATYPGHFTPNYARVVHVGFGEVRREAVEKLEKVKKHTTFENVRSDPFYRAVIKTCDAAILMSKRYAEGCRRKAETASPERRAELLKMADSCDWIMEHPARTFWEGLQAMLFYQYIIAADGLHWADSPALIDSILGGLLEKDLQSGELTPEQAQELADAYILQAGNQIIMFPKPNNDQLIAAHKEGKTLFDLQGASQNVAAGMLITIGGMHVDGTGEYNLATKLFLLSYYRLRVAEPSLALRVNKDMPDEIWELAIELGKHSGGFPQFNNDAAIIPALVNRGASLEDARRYAVFGCVEPCIAGKEWSMACNCGIYGGLTSMLDLLNYCIYGNVNPMTGQHGKLPCKKLYEYATFEEFKAEFERQVKYDMDVGTRNLQYNTLVFDQAWPCISASVMMEGCLESGKDVTWGGAKYTGHGAMFSAVATVADSLMAIKKLCFDDKTVTTRELYDALLANWEGHEMLRQKVLNDIPYYGNDLDEPDEIVQWITNLWADYFNSRPGPLGGTLNAGALDLYWVGTGKMTWATPDGRLTGEALSPCSDPMPCAVHNGPLSYVKSVAKMPWSKIRCGGAINLRLDANSVSNEDSSEKVRALIESYFDMGGIQFHFTVADTSVMRAAQKNPKEYEDLIVRIAGFSAYFTHLPPDDQENYIQRFEITV